MTVTSDTTPPGDGLLEALHHTGPVSEHAEKLMLFGRFVGSWNLEWSGTGTDGQPATMTGELNFRLGPRRPCSPGQLEPDTKPNSFTWRAETSRDGGARWQFDEQMLATPAERT